MSELRLVADCTSPLVTGNSVERHDVMESKEALNDGLSHQHNNRGIRMISCKKTKVIDTLCTMMMKKMTTSIWFD